MAQNRIPVAPGAIIVMATKARPGLVKYGTTLGITQITPALLDTDSTTLGDAITAFNATRVGRTNAHATLNTASAAAKTFLTGARGILLPLWGDTYNQQWAAAGWTDNSTAVPNNQPGRLALTLAIAGFLKANPTMEATTPGVTFTQAQANAVATALSAGLTGVGTADSASRTAHHNRAAAEKALRGDLRTLIAILNDKLTPNDSRWAEFGLNAPGAAVTPKAPTGLHGHAAGIGQIYATCDMPPGTDHLFWWMKTPEKAEFARVADTANGELILTGQTSGKTVQIYATAVNPAGESVPSATISVTVG